MAISINDIIRKSSEYNLLKILHNDRLAYYECILNLYEQMDFIYLLHEVYVCRNEDVRSELDEFLKAKEIDEDIYEDVYNSLDTQLLNQLQKDAIYQWAKLFNKDYTNVVRKKLRPARYKQFLHQGS